MLGQLRPVMTVNRDLLVAAAVATTGNGTFASPHRPRYDRANGDKRVIRQT